MHNPTSLRSHMKSFEEYLRGLYAFAAPLTTADAEGVYTFTDLAGLLQGRAHTTAADVDAVLYQEPPEMDANA